MYNKLYGIYLRFIINTLISNDIIDTLKIIILIIDKQNNR